MRQALKPGAEFGLWRLAEFIARGRNGSVWKATHADGSWGAIKLLHASKRVDAKRYERFRHEIE